MYHFIVNLRGAGGRAKLVWDEVRSLMDSRGLEYKYHVSQRSGNASALARQVCESDEDARIIVLGGDGTINEVLNGITDFSRVKLGVVPTGSGNDFIRGLGIPKNTRKALELILGCGDGRHIDLGLTTTFHDDGSQQKHYFGISSGIGMDAIVCKKTFTSKLKKVLNKIHLGKFIYIILTVQTLFSMETVPVEVKFDEDEPINFDKLIFMAGMNCRAEGGGVPMAPDSKVDDGLLSVCIASGITKLKAFLDLPILIAAGQKHLKGFYLRDFKKVTISAAHPMVVHADGEYAGDVRSLSMECLPLALNILM